MSTDDVSWGKTAGALFRSLTSIWRRGTAFVPLFPLYSCIERNGTALPVSRVWNVCLVRKSRYFRNQNTLKGGHWYDQRSNLGRVDVSRILQKYKRENLLKGSSCLLTSDSRKVVVQGPIGHFFAVTTFPPPAHTLTVHTEQSSLCLNKQIIITLPSVLTLTDSSDSRITIYNTTDQLLDTGVKFGSFVSVLQG